jgi:hypothetical protein
MGYFEDVYSSPERYGLRIIEETDGDQTGYGFDLVVLWEDVKTRKRYWGTDAGCSCPAPFEDYHSVSDLEDWALTKREYERAVQDACKRA